ncbi:Ger(x)C family spore germination protein [Clostridium sp. LBM24168]
MKKILCLFFILCNIFLSGCFNYRDMDKILFATAVIIDTDEKGNPVIYVESFKPEKTPSGAAGSGQRVLFRGSRKTIFETFRDIDLSSSYKLNYTQTRALIFTEKAAEKDMCKFIDIFARDQEFVLRSYIAVLRGDPQKLINTDLKEQEYIGVFVNDVIRNVPTSSRAVTTTLNDFLNSIYTTQSTSVLTMIELKSDQPEPKVEINNGAIIKNCKLVDILKTHDSLGYNFLIDNIKAGSLEVTNPSSPDNYISLEILSSKTYTKIHYDNKNVVVKKIITVRAAIAETEDHFHMDDITMTKLKQEAEKNIKDSCNSVFEKYKMKKLDIFNIQQYFERKYPKVKLQNPLEQSSLQLDINVNIEGPPTKNNFKY